MRNIQGHSNGNRYRSGILVIKGTRSFILAVTIILATSGVIWAQEPVVVTTVNRPVKTVKTDSVPAPEVIRAGSVSDTTRKAKEIPVSKLNSVILKSNSIVSLDRTSIGFGLGQDYGGLGGSILYYPYQTLGVFFGLGYNFVGVGYNLGLKFRIALGTSSSHIALSPLVMYGYNAAIIVENNRELSKVFHGFTIGAGIDIRPWSFNDDYITLGLNFPLRSSKVQEYINNLKVHYAVRFERELLPVTFSVGYRITIN